MVEMAQKHQILQQRRATALPRPDVMGFTPLRRTGAVGEAASAIAGVQPVSESRRDGPHRIAHRQRLAGRADGDLGAHRVAEEAPHQLTHHRAGPAQVTSRSTGLAAQSLHRDTDDDRRRPVFLDNERGHDSDQ